MKDKLIEELGKFASRLYDSRVAMYGPEVAAELVEILSRHADEQGEGLIEGLCGHCSGSGLVGMGPNIRGMKTCPTCNGKGKMTGIHPTPDKAVEPSKPEAKFSVDYWMVIQELVKLRSFDYKSKGYNADECQTIFKGNLNRIISMWDGKESICDKCEVLAKLGESKPTEPLAVLADRKGLFIDHSGAKVSDLDKVNHEWFIVIGNGLNTKTINENTYALAEAKARAYLMALEDKEGA